MLGVDLRAARWTWTAILVIVLVRAIYDIRKTVFILVVAVLFAYLLAPLVALLNRILPGKSRTLGLAVTYLLLVGGLVVLGFEIGSNLLDQAVAFAEQAPKYLANLSNTGNSAPLPGYVKWLQSSMFSHVQTYVQAHSSDLMSYVPQAGSKVLGVGEYLLFAVIVPILSFFLLKDAPVIRRQFVLALPEGPRRDTWVTVIEDTNKLLGQYVRAMGILCLTTFVVFAIAFSIFGLPYGILLASIAFPLEFIPMIGPLIAAVLVLTVAVATGFGHVWQLILFLGIYRMFQDYVFSPRLMSSNVEIHPILVILGVLAGQQIGGIAGMFVSVPVIALARLLYQRLTAVREIPEPALTPKD